MLNSLRIKNFRCLKELEIPSLGRVCLLTGKNNTGKSTILEALAIYANMGNFDLILQFLTRRGENVSYDALRKNSPEANLEVFSSLFTDHVVSLDGSDGIFIGSPDDSSKYLSLNIKENKQNFGVDLCVTNEDDDIGVYSIGATNIGQRFHKFPKISRFQLVRSNDIHPQANQTLFDEVSLTDRKQNVIDALRIIEPTVDDVGFIYGKAFVKPTNAGRVPLQSMGDGINRILTIILAMVNAVGGFLLIDEFENGLHYTAQEKLWKVILHLAQKLDIQVFATTHSNDCIDGFQQVLNASERPEDGKLIRLDRKKDGVIRPVEFDAHEMEIACDRDIEIR